MELKLIANIATIIGSLSIFLTLIFVGYELKENVVQSKLANQSNRDMLHSEWLHFWSSKENAALVIKGREDFHRLSQTEKFQFAQFICCVPVDILEQLAAFFFSSIIIKNNSKQTNTRKRAIRQTTRKIHVGMSRRKRNTLRKQMKRTRIKKKRTN